MTTTSMTKSMTTASTPEQAPSVRELRIDEIDAVAGGIINGCIVLPGIKILMPQPVGGFVDQFAPRVPSWVHMV